MHGHVGGNPAPPWVGGMPDLDANLRAYLYCGVTTILDPADIASQIFPRRERVRRGELLGPTIYAAGPMFTAPGGHPVPVLRQLAPWWLRWYLIPRLAMQVDTPEEARRAVDEVVGKGADVIKLGVDHLPDQAPRIGGEVLAAVVDDARRRRSSARRRRQTSSPPSITFRPATTSGSSGLTSRRCARSARPGGTT